jgi:transposase, IS30 family
MSYHQLTDHQRYQIDRMIALRKRVSEIAEFVGVHRSTIYREIERNGLEVYGSDKAIYEAIPAIGLTRDRRVEGCLARYKVMGKLRTHVLEKLKRGWSPEQIAGRAKIEGTFRVSYSSIYRYIEKELRELDGERLNVHLRRHTSKRRRRPKKRVCHGRKGAPKKSIRERPESADLRSEVGHFERDLMEGVRKKQRAVLVVTDRKSRHVTLRFVEKDGAKVQKLTAKILRQKKIRSIKKSVTNDNGSEFIQSISKSAENEFGVPVYFCDPCSPWQRGTVENTIGLLRQYIPKKYDFSKMNPQELKKIENRLNNRPRKVLNYRTPSEISLIEIKKKSL